MPRPWSRTTSLTEPLSSVSWDSTVPPGSLNLIAFAIRLARIRVRSWALPVTMTGVASTRACSRMPLSSASGRNASVIERTSSARSTREGRRVGAAPETPATSSSSLSMSASRRALRSSIPSTSSRRGPSSGRFLSSDTHPSTVWTGILRSWTSAATIWRFVDGSGAVVASRSRMSHPLCSSAPIGVSCTSVVAVSLTEKDRGGLEQWRESSR